MQTKMTEQIFISGATFEEFSDRVAEKVFQKINGKTDTQIPPQTSSVDILFKSLKEAADYYGVCYQNLSKELEKVDRLVIGNSIKIYKSALERAITVHGILPKRGGKK